MFIWFKMRIKCNLTIHTGVNKGKHFDYKDYKVLSKTLRRNLRPSRWELFSISKKKMKRKKLGGTNYTNTSHPRTTHARGDTCTVIHWSSRRESPLAALCLFFLSLSSLSLCATHMQRMTRSAQHPHHVSG